MTRAECGYDFNIINAVHERDAIRILFILVNTAAVAIAIWQLSTHEW